MRLWFRGGGMVHRLIAPVSVFVVAVFLVLGFQAVTSPLDVEIDVNSGLPYTATVDSPLSSLTRSYVLNLVNVTDVTALAIEVHNGTGGVVNGWSITEDNAVVFLYATGNMSISLTLPSGASFTVRPVDPLGGLNLTAGRWQVCGSSYPNQYRARGALVRLPAGYYTLNITEG